MSLTIVLSLHKIQVAIAATMVHQGEARLRSMKVETPIRMEGLREEEDHLVVPPVVRDVVATKVLPVFLY